METKKNLNNDLSIVQRQIEKFDNKANSLIAILSIVFAISLSMINVFIEIASSEMTQKNFIKYILLIIFSILYFISFVCEMVFLISVIYPRRKKGSDIKSLTYYWDVASMKDEEIKKLADKKNDCTDTIDQLKINSGICVKKHKNLVKAIWIMVPLFVFMFALFFTAII